jgi:hypothetical protein
MDSSPTTLLVPFAAVECGCHSKESCEECAKVSRFQPLVVLEELRFPFKGISSSWNMGSLRSTLVEGPLFEAAPPFFLLSRKQLPGWHRQEYPDGRTKDDHIEVGGPQFELGYVVGFLYVPGGCRGRDTAALALSQPPPVRGFHSRLSICTLAPGHVQDRMVDMPVSRFYPLVVIEELW